MFKAIFKLITGGVLALCLAVPAFAQETSALIIVNGDAETTLELADLQELPQSSFSTTTIWTEGPQEFVGVSLHDLVAELELEGQTLQAFAINDYSVEVPFEDADEDLLDGHYNQVIVMSSSRSLVDF